MGRKSGAEKSVVDHVAAELCKPEPIGENIFAVRTFSTRKSSSIALRNDANIEHRTCLPSTDEMAGVPQSLPQGHIVQARPGTETFRWRAGCRLDRRLG